MAMKKNISVNAFNRNIEIPNAYIKVGNVVGNKSFIEFEVLFSENSAFIKKESHTFTPDMQGGNFIAQAYEHLKTLPEFAGAIDC
jgi:hypothetical protein